MDVVYLIALYFLAMYYVHVHALEVPLVDVCIAHISRWMMMLKICGLSFS